MSRQKLPWALPWSSICSKGNNVCGIDSIIASVNVIANVNDKDNVIDNIIENVSANVFDITICLSIVDT